MSNATIRLFKAILITKKGKKNASKALLSETIKHGFIFSPNVIYNFNDKELLKLIDVVSKEIGLSSEALNNAFHKSWKKIAEANIEELVLEQILHYITTYGYEEMGIYSKDTIFVPLETLKLPKIKLDKLSLIVIKGYTKEELKSKLITLLGSGIALKDDTKKDIIDVVTFVDFKEEEIININNKEVKCALYDLLDIFPQEPVEFLRFLIYKSTNKTLLIKDRLTIDEIKTKDNLCVLGLLNKYQKKYGLEKLAEIFYRFKPLWLAFRSNAKLKTTINRIRKLANTYHKPMPEDYLNNITSKLKGSGVNTKLLKSKLSVASTFRKIRLAYALKFRTNKDANSILYRVRNGKSYATAFEFKNHKKAQETLDVVIDSIVKDISANVKGKKIYIPKNINYALPATEKQFTGDMPSGTYVSVPKDMIVGVHWEDLETPNKDTYYDDNGRVDLDLSLVNINQKIGWDGDYRSEGCNTLFSGDMTAAPKPNGASEFFYIKKQKEDAFALMLNYFNYSESVVPFKIIVGCETVKNFNHGYMINPNNVVVIANSKATEKQKLLGLLVTTPEECRFYFTETNIGNSITSYSDAEYVKQARKYMLDFYKNSIDLKDLLERAGAKIVDDQKKCDIDLSVETLEKDTIIKLLTLNK